MTDSTTPAAASAEARLGQAGLKMPFEYGLRRCYVISLTPFDESGQLDEGHYRAHLQRLAAGGVGIYVAGGASGEAFTFSREENLAVLRIAGEELAGKAPIRAMGVEPRSSKQMIEFASMAADAGLDAVQVYSLDQGHGLRPNDAELRMYYETVLDAITIPSVISSHHLAGYVLPIPLLVDLVDNYPGIVGINVSSPDLNYNTQLIDALSSRVEIHVGGIGYVIAALMLGAHGYMTSQGNLAPRISQSVIDCFVNNDLPGLTDAFARVLRLLVVDSRAGLSRGTKEALRQLGLPGGHVRPPRMPVNDAARADIATMLDQLDIRRLEGVAP